MKVRQHHLPRGEFCSSRASRAQQTLDSSADVPGHSNTAPQTLLTSGSFPSELLGLWNELLETSPARTRCHAGFAAPGAAASLPGRAANPVHMLGLQPAPSPHVHFNWIMLSLTHTDGKTRLCTYSVHAYSSRARHSSVWSNSSLLTEIHPP